MANLFYLKHKPENQVGLIEGKDVKHIKKVLRKKEGDEINCFYDQTLFRTRIKKLFEERIILEILSEEKNAPLPHEKSSVSLYLSIPKPQTLNDLLPPLNELGVSELFLVVTERSFFKKKEKINLERSQKIIQESSKQCCRTSPMIIHPPLFLEEINQKDPSKTKLEQSEKIICYELEKNQNLQNLKISKKNLCVFIGSEGGFKQSEVDFLKNIGFIPCSLSPFILRATTAAIASVSILQTLQTKA